MGVLRHVLQVTEANDHPAKAADLWANACHQWPQLQAYNLNDLCHVYVVKIPAQTDPWVLFWNIPFHTFPSESQWHTVIDWLRLPPGPEIALEY